MLKKSLVAILCAISGGFAVADAPPQRAASRGELLYQTHCIACHDANIHWRDKAQAGDWDSLRAQVRRWQEVGGLRWNDEDIAEVARYLNAQHYRYPMPD